MIDFPHSAMINTMRGSPASGAAARTGPAGLSRTGDSDITRCNDLVTVPIEVLYA